MKRVVAVLLIVTLSLFLYGCDDSDKAYQEGFRRGYEQAVDRLFDSDLKSYVWDLGWALEHDNEEEAEIAIAGMTEVIEDFRDSKPEIYR